MSVLTFTGCVDAESTDDGAALGGSQSVVPSLRVASTAEGASSTSAVATEGLSGDADAAAFTRSLFDNVLSTDPGCTVAVGRGGAVVFAEAYGAARLDPLEPMTVDTVVDIGSVSKQFTATAILLLAQRGMVDLDAPLATYLSDLPAWASRPTLAQMLHHDSGIPDHIDLLIDRGASLTGPSTVADALAALGDVAELDFAPGTQWAYSNSNYFLLSQVVPTVTGQDLGRFLAGEVFAPLGLDMVMDPTLVNENQAVSYGRVGIEWEVADTRWEALIGAGAVHTTPSQLVVWAAQYWDPTLGTPPIDDERFDAAVDAGAGDRYGAGIVEVELDDVGRVLTHDGTWGGFVTLFSVVPSHRLAIAVTCTSPDTMLKVANRLDIKLLESWTASS